MVKSLSVKVRPIIRGCLKYSICLFFSRTITKEDIIVTLDGNDVGYRRYCCAIGILIKSVISQLVRQSVSQSVSQSLVNVADTISRHGPLNSKVCLIGFLSLLFDPRDTINISLASFSWPTL